MSEFTVLDTTEKIRTRLETEFSLCSSDLQLSVLNCLGYKTTFYRPEGRKPSICPQWEHFNSVIESRESLNYRLGSLIWHCRQFPKHQHEFAERISNLKITRQDHFNESRDAYYVVSYILDDVVFCAVSVFDYLAALIYNINQPEKRGQKFWSDLVKDRKKLEDQKLAGLIEKTNDNLVKSLSKLRGRSIHSQADFGKLKQTESYNSHGITHSFDYLMPEEARRRLPFFDEKKDFSIEPGAYLIALHTIVRIRTILVQLGNYEYTCVYDPMKKHE